MSDSREELNKAPLHVDKPWGGFDQYTLNQTATVKILTVDPEQALSLQTHEHRDELWVVVEGDVQIQVGEEIHQAQVGQEFFIPRGTLHRIITGATRARVLEISLGYFDEEDLIRVADRYGRS